MSSINLTSRIRFSIEGVYFGPSLAKTSPVWAQRYANTFDTYSQFKEFQFRPTKRLVGLDALYIEILFNLFTQKSLWVFTY